MTTALGAPFSEWIFHSVIVALVVLLARQGAAQTSSPNIVLVWEAPPSCPGREAVLERLNALLTARPDNRERVHAHGRVVPGEQGLSLVLETKQGERTWQRSIQASSCEELSEAAALILALAVDPDLGSTVTSTAPSDSAGPTATPAAPTPAGSTDTKTSPSPRPVRPPAAPARRRAISTDEGDVRPGLRLSDLDLRANASVLLDFGSLPRPAVGTEGSFGVGVRHFEVSFVGSVIPEVRQRVADTPDRGGDIALWALGVRGCYRMQGTMVAAHGCAGMEAGRMRAEGFGTTGWRALRTTGWAAGRIGLRGTARLVGPLGAEIGVEALVPATRPEFVIEGLGPVHRPSAIVGRAAAGLSLLF